MAPKDFLCENLALRVRVFALSASFGTKVKSLVTPGHAAVPGNGQPPSEFRLCGEGQGEGNFRNQDQCFVRRLRHIRELELSCHGLRCRVYAVFYAPTFRLPIINFALTIMSSFTRPSSASRQKSPAPPIKPWCLLTSASAPANSLVQAALIEPDTLSKDMVCNDFLSFSSRR